MCQVLFSSEGNDPRQAASYQLCDLDQVKSLFCYFKMSEEGRRAELCQETSNIDPL